MVHDVLLRGARDADADAGGLQAGSRVQRDARHTAVRQSLVHRLRGGKRGAGAEYRAYRGAYRAASRRGGGRALVLFAALYRLEHRQQSLERLDQPAGAGNDRLAGVFPGVRHPLRYGRKPGETGADPVGASGGAGDDPLRRSGEQAIRPYRRDRGRDL